MTGPDEEAAREREALALFAAMFDIPPAERDEWIVQQTAGRPALQDRLRSMLAADMRISLQTGGATGTRGDEAAPDRVGAYRITGLIGRGGMGSVYRGERDTGDFDHAVAIKVIKPGLLSSALVERFERERQTLAALSHPNIARLYDGGRTLDGSPFIVMELVAGRPLLEWAEESGADRAARLAVMQQICAGVAFAHRNLVVHRDLTPSNVLVSADGIARLIDFGIARPADAADQQAVEVPAGSLASLSLTPGYAAPERHRSSAVTTAADIYSLGKLLEALFAGDADPELAAIVARATQPSPGDRYPTVEALAADLGAWAADRPVAAMGPGRGYLLRKFVRRNRRAVTAASVAAALLLGSYAVTGWSLYRAQTARAAEAERFGEVRRLATYLLFDLNDRLAQVPGNTAARADLARRAQDYLDILAASADPPADLRLELARGLVRLAQIQGVPDEPNLGEIEQAQTNLAQARRILATLPSGRLRSIEQARADVYQGLMLLHGDFEQADAMARFQRAATELLAIPAQVRSEDWHRVRRAQRLALLEYADLSEQRDTIPQIAAALRADHAAWPANLRATWLDESDEAVAAYYEALRLSFADDERSTGLFLANERRFDALLAARPYDSYLLYRSAWNSFDGFAAASRWGREEQSDRLIRKTAELVDRLLAIDPQDNSVTSLAANVREGLAQNLRDQGAFADAIALQQRVVAMRRQRLERGLESSATGNTAFSLAILGIIARDAGNRQLACASYGEAESLFSELAARGEILGFQENLLGGLRDKKRACANGASIEGPLR